MLETIAHLVNSGAWLLLLGNVAVLGLAALAEFAPRVTFASSLRSLYKLFTPTR